LPKAVKELEPALRAGWLESWEMAYEYARKKALKNPEAHATKIANGWLKREQAKKDQPPFPWTDDEGVVTLEMAKKAARLEVEIFRAGSYGWKGTYSVADVRHMASDYEPSFHEAPVVIDHEERGPALGWVARMRADSEGRLYASLKDLQPEFAQQIADGAYKKRSVAINRNFPATGRPHIMHVAFLGAANPHVKGMEDPDLSAVAHAFTEFETFRPSEWISQDTIMFMHQAHQKEFRDGEDNGQHPAADDEPSDSVGGLGGQDDQEIALKDDSDGQYPLEAYAHAPDPTDPATWAVRVWTSSSGEVTEKWLRRLAALFSTGGVDGLKIGAVVSDAAAHPLIRARLRAEFRRLGIGDSEQPTYIQEGDMERFIDEQTVTLEASMPGDDKVWPVRIITAGTTRCLGFHYPTQTLQEAEREKVFEEAVMRVNHIPEEELRRAGGVEQVDQKWVAVLKNVSWAADAQALRGEAHIIQPWFQEMLAGLRDAGSLEKMRVSIRAVGVSKGSFENDKGGATRIVDQIVKCRSVDFVMEDAAGGYVSLAASTATAPTDVDLITLEALEQARPDLLREMSERIDAQNAKEDGEMEETVKELKERIEALEGEKNEYAEQVEAKDAEIDELREKCETTERENARVKAREKLDELLAADECKDQQRSEEHT
nr:hypothetical protein [Gammaproteobacteria bacterium]